ncbi:MAG TPA: hypothetical protein VKE53_01100 [Pseudolabrys sp.]|jgi:CheY-like chemotaxis protein|nr:hypothetical protein [Pseudolabrys sp.]
MSEVVLIADDDPVQRRLLEAMVKRFGYQPMVAEGGIAAIKLLAGPEAKRIDAMVLDLRFLPKLLRFSRRLSRRRH